MQQTLFGEPDPPPLLDRPPEKTVRELVALGCDPDKAKGFSVRRAHVVLRKLRQKAEREQQQTAANASPARAGNSRSSARRETNTGQSDGPERSEGDDEPEYAEPLRWHLFPWDRPAITVVIDGLDEMAKLLPEVVLPRCVFWAIRHLPPADLRRLIVWLREVLIDARERLPRDGGDAAAGGGERVAGEGERGRDAGPHVADAGAALARFAPDEVEPEPRDDPGAFDGP